VQVLAGVNGAIAYIFVGGACIGILGTTLKSAEHIPATSVLG
jgi:hypothetical protein